MNRKASRKRPTGVQEASRRRTRRPQSTWRRPKGVQEAPNSIYSCFIMFISDPRSAAPPPRGEHGVLDSKLGSCRVLPGPKFPRPGILGFRCLAQDPCQTRRGFNPSLPPGAQPHAADPCFPAPFWRPSVELLPFLVNLCAPQKS